MDLGITVTYYVNRKVTQIQKPYKNIDTFSHVEGIKTSEIPLLWDRHIESEFIMTFHEDG